MQIGVFDSGLGGLAIAQALMNRLPDYDVLYLGDTKRVPYGGRSQGAIHSFVSEGLTWMFDQDCALIVLACNTASAESLRKSQQEYLPRHYPDRRVLGMIIPSAEAVFEGGGAERVGVLATASTVESGAYTRELRRIAPEIDVVARPAPLLVPLVEHDGLKYVGPILDDLLGDMDVDALILGCTHYCLLKEQVRSRTRARVISQDEVIPDKLADYLLRHPELERRLSRSGRRRYAVTDLTAGYVTMAKRLIGEESQLDLVDLASLQAGVGAGA